MSGELGLGYIQPVLDPAGAGVTTGGINNYSPDKIAMPKLSLVKDPANLSVGMPGPVRINTSNIKETQKKKSKSQDSAVLFTIPLGSHPIPVTKKGAFLGIVGITATIALIKFLG